MKKNFIEIPEVGKMYKASLVQDIPEYAPINIAHAVVTEGGKTLRMSGYPAIGLNGIVGKGDMGVQAIEAMEHVRRTIEAAGGTWDDIVHMMFFFTDREQWWRKALPARVQFFEKYSKTGRLPCITAIGVAALMHPDMLIEVEATAVFE